MINENAVTRDADGKLKLAEEYVDVTALPDDALKALRGFMVSKKSECDSKFASLGDDRYSSPEGNVCLRDCNYYDDLIRTIECEMKMRMLVLESAAEPLTEYNENHDDQGRFSSDGDGGGAPGSGVRQVGGVGGSLHDKNLGRGDAPGSGVRQNWKVPSGATKDGKYPERGDNVYHEVHGNGKTMGPSSRISGEHDILFDSGKIVSVKGSSLRSGHYKNSPGTNGKMIRKTAD